MITTPSPPRIATLDILRGVAVMGILAMNIAGFALPEAAYFNPRAFGGAEGLDLVSWTASFILVDGKMRGLFSLLFGASALLVMQRAEAGGGDAASVHYRRMAWLAVFGAIHFYLIWYGDILLHYAMIGPLLYAFRNAPPRTLGLWVAILLAVDVVIMGGFAFAVLGASAAAAAPGADPAVVASWAGMSADFAVPSPAALAADLAIHRGDYPGIVAHRFADDGWFPLFLLAFNGPETLALMLIGMAGLKSGFLTGGWSDARYRTVALIGVGIGAIGFAALAAIQIRANFDTAITIAAAFGGSVLFRPMMVVGYAALIVPLTRAGGVVVVRIAAAGRAAFTNYLGTSIVMTLLFYGYGLGLYGRLGRAELWLVVAAAWLVMLAWSKPWLDRFRYGPFEWLWRSLARGKPQPMRRLA